MDLRCGREDLPARKSTKTVSSELYAVMTPFLSLCDNACQGLSVRIFTLVSDVNHMKYINRFKNQPPVLKARLW